MRSCLAMTPHDLERLTLRRRKERRRREKKRLYHLLWSSSSSSSKKRRSRRRHFISQKMKWGGIKCRRFETVPTKSGNYSRVASKSQRKRKLFVWKKVLRGEKKVCGKQKGRESPLFPLLSVEMSFFLETIWR